LTNHVVNHGSQLAFQSTNSHLVTEKAGLAVAPSYRFCVVCSAPVLYATPGLDRAFVFAGQSIVAPLPV